MPDDMINFFPDCAAEQGWLSRLASDLIRAPRPARPAAAVTPLVPKPPRDVPRAAPRAEATPAPAPAAIGIDCFQFR